MIGLHKLEQTTNRQRCCPRLTRRTGDRIPLLITIGAALLAVIFLILLLVRSTAPVKQNPTPYPEVVSNAQSYFSKLQGIITSRVETESPAQQHGLTLFQQQQQKLSELVHSKHSHSRIGTVLNSIYTPEPIFVPQISYLLSLPGSCHPVRPKSDSIPSKVVRDHDGMKDSGLENTNAGATASTSAHGGDQDQICHKCDDQLIAMYPALLTTQHCQSSPIVSIYECDIDNGESDGGDIARTPTVVAVPCTSAYVDGVQQFWALYSIAIILTLTSSILVRRRFDKAQKKVLRTLIKPQQR